MRRIFYISILSKIACNAQKYEEIDTSRNVYCTQPESIEEEQEQCDFRMCGCINDYVPGLQREFDFEKISTCSFNIEHMNCTERLIDLSKQREDITKELAMDEESEAAAQAWLEEKLRKKAENRKKRQQEREAKKAEEFEEEAETWARSLDLMQNDAMTVVECTEEESEEECEERQSASKLSYEDYKRSQESKKEERRAKQDCTKQENIDNSYVFF